MASQARNFQIFRSLVGLELRLRCSSIILR
jgi:hypothetical protein